MPGSVAVASPTTVLPQFLCRAFAHSREYSVPQSSYSDGSRQVHLLTTSSLKSWPLTAVCTPTILSALSAFYLARKGPLEPFYFYDLTVAGAVHDPTGVATTGRFTVHFSGEYQGSLIMGKSEASFMLVEVA